MRPGITAWIEQGRDLSGDRIDSCQIWSLMQVASMARQEQDCRLDLSHRAVWRQCVLRGEPTYYTFGVGGSTRNASLRGF